VLRLLFVLPISSATCLPSSRVTRLKPRGTLEKIMFRLLEKVYRNPKLLEKVYRDPSDTPHMIGSHSSRVTWHGCHSPIVSTGIFADLSPLRIPADGIFLKSPFRGVSHLLEEYLWQVVHAKGLKAHPCDSRDTHAAVPLVGFCLSGCNCSVESRSTAVPYFCQDVFCGLDAGLPQPCTAIVKQHRALRFAPEACVRRAIPLFQGLCSWH